MISIFTEAGQTIGLGHLIRMRSLKRQLAFDGYKVELLVQLEGKEFGSSFTMEQDEREVQWIDNTELVELEIDCTSVVVLDSYKVTEKMLAEIVRRSARVIVIDDCNLLHYKNCIVVNPNYYGSYIDYPREATVEYCVGARYTLLRPEFSPPKERIIQDNVQRILLTFGGTDVLDLTARVAEYCQQVIPGAKLDIVATGSYNSLSRIKDIVRGVDSLYIDITASEMNDLMGRADFAIAAAGSTINELIKTQCPSIVTMVAENQAMVFEYLEPRGLFLSFAPNNLSTISEMLDSQVRSNIYRKLKMMETSESATVLVERVCDQYKKRLHDLRGVDHVSKF